MPLVTRTSTTGGLFRQDEEPGSWQNGDLWSETDTGIVYVNINGNAVPIAVVP